MQALQFLHTLEVCEKSQTSSFNKAHREMCNKTPNCTECLPRSIRHPSPLLCASASSHLHFTTALGTLLTRPGWRLVSFKRGISVSLAHIFTYIHTTSATTPVCLFAPPLLPLCRHAGGTQNLFEFPVPKESTHTKALGSEAAFA